MQLHAGDSGVGSLRGHPGHFHGALHTVKLTPPFWPAGGSRGGSQALGIKPGRVEKTAGEETWGRTSRVGIQATGKRMVRRGFLVGSGGWQRRGGLLLLIDRQLGSHRVGLAAKFLQLGSDPGLPLHPTGLQPRAGSPKVPPAQGELRPWARPSFLSVSSLAGAGEPGRG